MHGRTLAITGRRQYVESEDEDAAPAGEPETSTIDFRIVGVMAAALSSLQAESTEAWRPVEIGGPLLMADWEELRTSSMLRAIGRRAAGVTSCRIEAASVRIHALGAFEISLCDAPLDGGPLQRNRPLEPLKALIALGSFSYRTQHRIHDTPLS